MDWVIPLFADGSLQGSILVPILLGVLVATLFTEWYGWSFSGIVVPGYLTPIIIIAPFSAAVIGLEAIIVLLIARVFTDTAPRWGVWAPLFGRDRFLLIFYLSVVVRLVLELGILPGLEGSLQELFPGIDFRNRFTGIGLVVVPLLANMMWKPGILRGFGQAAVTTSLTWALLTWVLVPHTNFNLGQFYLIYETMALDFAASPTAYIVLLVGALFAAQLNLFLGWDFNGIMVPTLLAISIFQPATFVLTFVEALVIYGATWLLVRAPAIRTMSFEGPRLVALMYSVGLMVKLLLEHLDLHPGAVFGDPQLNAYGYLLSTLVAAKMWQKHQALRILVPIVQVAIMIAVFGGLGVWGFNALADASWHQQARLVLGEQPGRELRHERGDLMHLVNRELTRFLRPGGGLRVERMQAFEQQLYTEIVRGCARHAAGANGAAELQRLAAAAEQLGCELLLLEDENSDDRLLVLRESPVVARYRGWGLVALRIGAQPGLTVTTPRPLADRGSAAAAVALADLCSARALVLPGAHFQTNSDGTSDPLRWTRLPMHLALQALRDDALLEVRVAGPRRTQTALPAGPRLWIERRLPEQLRLRDLETWVGGLEVLLSPQPSPVDNEALRRGRRPGFASLQVDPHGYASLVGHRILAGADGERLLPEHHGLQFVRARCEELKTHAFMPARRSLGQQDLLFAQQQVFWPLLEAADDLEQTGEAGQQTQLLLAAAAENAERIGYRLELVARDRGQRFAMLSERPDEHRGRGTFLIRLGGGEPIHLLVPQPISIPGSLDAGLALLDHLGAKALSIGPLGIEESGRRGRDRHLRFERESLYQLLHQLIQRRAWETEPVLSLELRGTSSLAYDLLLRQGRRIGGEGGLSPRAGELLSLFRSRGWTVKILGDDYGDEFYGLGANRQLSYSSAYQAGPFVAVWLNRALRARLRFDRADDPHLQALRHLGLVGEPVHLAAALHSLADRQPVTVPQALAREALAYARDRNLRRIELLAHECALAGVPLALHQDRDSNAVVCALGSGAEMLVIDLGAWDESHVLLDPQAVEASIDRFLVERARSLWREVPE